MPLRKSTHIVKYPVTRKSSLLLFLLATVLFSSLSNGCDCNSYHAEDIYFPVQKEPQDVELETQWGGKLVIDDGYLRAQDTIIIWPYGYSLKEENGKIWIYDETSNPLATTGDQLGLGGAFVSASRAEELIGQKLPEGITGPFWNANKGIRIENIDF